jgi:hypothetical protein
VTPWSRYSPVGWAREELAERAYERQHRRILARVRDRHRADNRLFDALQSMHRLIRRQVNAEARRGELIQPPDEIVAAEWRRFLTFLRATYLGRALEADLERWEETIPPPESSSTAKETKPS